MHIEREREMKWPLVWSMMKTDFLAQCGKPWLPSTYRLGMIGVRIPLGSRKFGIWLHVAHILAVGIPVDERQKTYLPQDIKHQVMLVQDPETIEL